MKTHAALVLRKDNKILFVQRSMKKKALPGAWAFPSGTVEQGEDVFDTIKREAVEELGVEVECEKVMAETNLDEFSVKLVFVLCSVINKTPSIEEPDEIEKIEWMTFSEFFEKFSDSEIGHGLVWLRKNPEIWREIK